MKKKKKADKKRLEDEKFGSNLPFGIEQLLIVPLPKSETRHPAPAQVPLHLPYMLFFDTTKLYKPLSLIAVVFLCFRGRPISARKQHVGS